MSVDVLRTIAIAVIALATVMYPIGVYYGLRIFEPKLVGAIFLFVAVARQLVSRPKRETSTSNASRRAGATSFQWVTTAVAVAMAVAVWVSNEAFVLRFYPVLINATLLAIFARSLALPPTIIERLARLTDPDLPPHAVAYTRKVTVAWCVFFAMNGTAALATTLFASMEIWTLYNGLIAYVLMGAMFVVEYPIRVYVRQKHANA